MSPYDKEEEDDDDAFEGQAQVAMLPANTHVPQAWLACITTVYRVCDLSMLTLCMNR